MTIVDKESDRLLRSLKVIVGTVADLEQRFQSALREVRPRVGWDSPSDDTDEGVELPAIVRVRRGSSVSLFDFQCDLVEQMVGLVASSGRAAAGLLSLPTGAGKTRTACTACLRLMSSGNVQRVLWVAPTVELLEQAMSAFSLLVQAGEGPPAVSLVRSVDAALGPENDVAIFFATCQLLASRAKGAILRLPSIDLLVFDEAHFAIAPSYLEAVSKLRQRSVPLIGLTATPGRKAEEQSERLAALFDNRWLVSRLLGRRPVDRLRERGVLSSVVFKRIDFEGAAPGNYVSRRHRKTLPIDQLTSHQGRLAATIDTIRALPRDERTIVFAGSLKHAAALTLALRTHDVRAGVVSGYQDPATRRSVLASFEQGTIQVLINKSVLIAGYDCPATKHVVLTIPVGSPITFEQMVGRASRGPLVGGGPESYVWQLDDMMSIHGPPSSYSRFDANSWFRR